MNTTDNLVCNDLRIEHKDGTYTLYANQDQYVFPLSTMYEIMDIQISSDRRSCYAFTTCGDVIKYFVHQNGQLIAEH